VDAEPDGSLDAENARGLTGEVRWWRKWPYSLCGMRSSTKLDIHKDIKDINPAKSKDLILNGVFLRESILWQDNILLINNKLIILVTSVW